MDRKILTLILFLVILLALIDISIFNYKENSSSSNNVGKSSINSSSNIVKVNFNSTNSSIIVYVSQPYGLLVSKLFNNVTLIPLGDILLSNFITNTTPDILVSNGFYDLIYPNKVKWIIFLKTDEIVFIYNGQYNFIKLNNNFSIKEFFDYITSGNVKVGSVNPSISSTGIYFHLILEIAGEIFYKNSSYYLQRCLVNNCEVDFPSDAELINVFKNGGIQLAITYKSLAEELGLKYIELPDYLNFGNEEYSSFYSKFNYSIKLNNQEVFIQGKPNFIYITALTEKGAEYIYQLINSNNLQKFFPQQYYPIIFKSIQELPSQIYLLYQEGILKNA